MVGNCQGDRVQVGSLPPPDVDLTLAAGSELTMENRRDGSYGFAWTTAASQSIEACTVQRCCMNVPS